MPNYNFQSLSPADFEDLIRDLLIERLHLEFESFGPGRDRGIDLRHSYSKDRTTIIQCKHFELSGYIALEREIRLKEISKIRLLCPQRYILATSVNLNPDRKNKLLNLLSPFCKNPGDIFGAREINALLGRFGNVERRHFKLWLTSEVVLQKVLHNATYNKSKLTLDEIRKRHQFYVQNESFFTARRILRKLHYCIIAGIPGIGKTTLAEALMAKFVTQGFQLIRISKDIDEGFAQLNETGKQAFYYDDFLGKTSMAEKFGKNEEQRLLQFIEHVRQSKEKRFILTTREYILNQAKQTYERLATSRFDLRKCVIDLSSYTRIHRARILYNHIHFSGLKQDYTAALLQNQAYLSIIDHRHYNPRVIESMTNHVFLEGIPPNRYAREFLRNLDDPSLIWAHPFERQLSEAARNSLFVLASMPDEVFLEDFESAFANYSGSAGGAQSALEELDGNFINSRKRLGRVGHVLSFHNPSVRDFLKQYLRNRPNVLIRLLRTATFAEQPALICALLLEKPKIQPSPLMREAMDTALTNTAKDSTCRFHLIHRREGTRAAPYYEDKLQQSFGTFLETALKADRDGLLSQGESVLLHVTELLSTHLRSDVAFHENKSQLRRLLLSIDQTHSWLFEKSQLLDSAKAFYTTQTTWPEDFEEYLEFRDAFPGHVSGAEHEAVIQIFLNSMPRQTREIIESSAADAQWVSEQADLLENIAKRFKISPPQEVEELRDWAADNPDSPGPDGPDDDDRIRSGSTKDDDRVIRNLFESLE